MNTPLAALPRPHLRRATGFTLIELMITVAIVAILATIAYPSYRNYVIRGQVINATNGLSALQANMERYYQDNRTYANVTTPTPFTSPCKAAAATLVVGNFQLSCIGTLDNANYTLQAQGITGTVAGFTYTVTQANIKNTTITGTSNWNTAGMTCWVIKEGPQC